MKIYLILKRPLVINLIFLTLVKRIIILLVFSGRELGDGVGANQFTHELNILFVYLE